MDLALARRAIYALAVAENNLPRDSEKARTCASNARRELELGAAGELQRQALKATRWRGHVMRWTWYSELRVFAVGQCKRCGMEVTCDPRSAPNGIDIGGEAVTLNCSPA